MDVFSSICENRDFRRLYKRGRSFVGASIVMYIGKGRSDTVRIGITVGKKIGNAVKRNRVRRVIREAFRMTAPFIKTGLDIIIVARTRALFLKSTDIQKEMIRQLKKAGVLN